MGGGEKCEYSGVEKSDWGQTDKQADTGLEQPALKLNFTYLTKYLSPKV